MGRTACVDLISVNVDAEKEIKLLPSSIYKHAVRNGVGRQLICH